MVLVNQVDEPVKQGLALFLCEAVDMLDMSTNGKDTFPPSHRICANDWMNGFKLASDIFWGSTRLFVKLEAASLRGIIEPWLGKGCGECLQKLLIRLTDAVVDFIS